jgi:hypothetical protein
MRGNPMMRTRMPALTIIALLGFCIQANAQAPCPELTPLKQSAVTGPTPGAVMNLRTCAS